MPGRISGKARFSKKPTIGETMHTWRKFSILLLMITLGIACLMTAPVMARQSAGLESSTPGSFWLIDPVFTSISIQHLDLASPSLHSPPDHWIAASKHPLQTALEDADSCKHN
jgi:hypothetical protein